MIKSIKVANMLSPRTNNKVANQFIITTDGGSYFQSYQSIIAFEDHNGNITLDKYFWDYSATTLKYLKCFLMNVHSKKEIEKRIADGTYKLASLN